MGTASLFALPISLSFIRCEAEAVLLRSGACNDGRQSGLVRCAGGLAALCAAMLLASGCNQGPSRIEAPDWDPPALAERIVSELDENGDAHVDGQEWTAAPGLAAGARFIDNDKDGRLSREEIEARFQLYRELRVGLRSRAFRVTYKGRPVAGADTLFLPEPFLEGVIEPAHGKTDEQGIVVPHSQGQDLPGMRIGLYRVQVRSPRLKIPAKYTNDATMLGVEASPVSDDAAAYGVTELRLTD